MTEAVSASHSPRPDWQLLLKGIAPHEHASRLAAVRSVRQLRARGRSRRLGIRLCRGHPTRACSVHAATAANIFRYRIDPFDGRLAATSFEYAHAFAWHYPGGRFLVEAAGATDLRIPLLRLAPQLGLELTDAEQKDLSLGYARVRAALEAGERALLILDNLDDAGLLAPHLRAQLLPASDQIHVLVTTRLGGDRLEGIDCLPLEALADQEALELLGKHRAIEGDDEWKAALRLVHLLGGHALAVEVVGVYLWKHQVSYTAYLARLEHEGTFAALSGAGEQVREQLSRHPQTLVGPLLQPTLAGLTPEETRAVQYAALLPPDSVALPWLRELVGREFPGLTEVPQPGYPDAWGQLVRRLFGLRLLTRGDGEPLARMHRILQEVVTAQQDSERVADLRRTLVDHARGRAEQFTEYWSRPERSWELAPLRELALAAMRRDEPTAVHVAQWLAEPIQYLTSLAEAAARLDNRVID